jgi:hypothetical protein
MAVTRIRNNQVTDSSAGNTIVGINAGTKLQDYSVTSGKIANNLVYGSDLTVTGNLTVQGNTTSIDSTITTIEDPVIVLASTQTGSPTVDIGFIGERGTSNNIAFVWDESSSEFVTVFTSDTETNTTVTITSYANFHTNDANVGGNIVINGTTSLVGNLIGNVNATANITGGNLSTSGLITVTGNVIGGNIETAGQVVATSNVTGGNLLTGGSISATGNVTAANFIGNIVGNVDAGGANTNIQFNDNDILAGSAAFTFDKTSNAVIASGNVTAGNFTTLGNIVINDPALTVLWSNGQINTAGPVISTGNVTAGNLLTSGSGGSITLTGGNITGANNISANTVTATGNVTGGNIETAGQVVATGNVTGGNLLTDGFVSATGNLTTAGNIVASGYANITGNINGSGAVFSGNVTADTFIGNISGNVDAGGANTNIQFNDNDILAGSAAFTFDKTSNAVIATGNVTAGNIDTAGQVVATGNITAGNLLTSGSGGSITLTGGNITGANNIGSNTVTATGNVTGGNINTAGLVTATGNIITTANVYSNNLIVTDHTQTGTLTTTGNALIGGNLVVQGNLTYINIEDLRIEDPVIILGTGPNGAPLTVDDGLDRGIFMEYFEATNGNAFVGFKNLSGNMVIANDVYFSANDVVGINSYGTLEAGNLYIQSAVSIGNIEAGNLQTTGLISATGNITAGNLLTSGSIVLSGGNITGANVISANTVSAIGNVTAGNIDTAGNVVGGNVNSNGLVFATGNVVGGNVNSNGLVFATGNVVGDNINATGNVNGGNINTQGLVFATGNVVAGNINTSGNVIAGNVSVTEHVSAGYITSAGNILGNLLFSLGTVSAVGNVIGGNIDTNGLILANGNITGGNLLTSGLVSVAGNVTAQYFIGNILGNVDAGGSNTQVQFNDNDILNGSSGFIFDKTANSVTVTGNITGGNLITAGNVYAPAIVNNGTFNTDIQLGAASGIIAVTTAGNSTQFKPSGQIELGGIAQVVSGTFSGSGIALGTSQTDIFQNRDGNVTVQVGTGGATTSTWTFANSGNLLAPGNISAVGNITGANIVGTTSGTFGNIVISGDDITDTNGRVNFNTAGADVDFAVNGDTVANVFYVDAGTGTASFGTSAQTTDALVAFNTPTSVLIPVGNIDQRPGTGVTGMMRFNTSTNALEIYNNTQWEAVGNPEFTVIDNEQFLGDGSTVAFTLSSTQTTNSCIVSINGVLQIPVTAYSVSGIDPTCVLTFTEAPAPGDVIDVREITTTTSVTTLENSPGNAKIQVFDDSSILNVTGNLVPTANVSYSLGSATNYWQSLYVGGNTIYLGNLQLKAVTGETFAVYQSDGTTQANIDIGNIDVSSITSGTTAIGIGSPNGNAYITVGGTANVLVVSTASANVTGTLGVTGNITGSYIFGNGSQLTGIDATGIQNGSANVRTFLNGNVTISAAGTSNVLNVTSTGLITTGFASVTGNVTGGNLTTTGITSTGSLTASTTISAAGNITGGNLTTTGITSTGSLTASTTISAAGNITGGNLLTGGLISVAGNITGGNLLTGGLISVAGNITGGNVNTSAVRNGSGDLDLDTAGNINVNSNYINNVLNPVQPQDVATKTYVDNLVASGTHFHQPVRVESPTALNATYNNGTAGVGATLTNAGANAALVVDGVTVANTNRVLVYQQANAVQNGVYVVSNAGNATSAWQLTRSDDTDTYVIDSPTGLSGGSTFFVQEGATGAGETYTCNNTGTITFGTTNITFAQISTAQIYSANTSAGMSLNGTVFSTKVDNTTTAFDGGGNIIVKTSAQLTSPNIGAATGTSLSVTGAVTGASVVGGVMTGTSLSVTGAVTGASVVGGVMTGTSLSVTGAVTGTTLTGTSLTVSTGNITGGNLLISGAIVDSGQLDIRTSASNSNIALAPNGTGVVTVSTQLSAVGNVTAGNLITAGLVSLSSITKTGGNGVGNIGSSTSTFNTIFAKATSAQYADLAEKYVADAEYAPGTVVVFGGDREVTVTSTDADRAVAGVVSTNPSYIMNAGLEAEHVATVALTGRVPCRVTGTVKKGDMMVSAGYGLARAEQDPRVGTVIGKALENHDGSEGVIEVVVGRF